MGEQEKINLGHEVEILKGDDLDKAVHDCMTSIWKAYRADVKTYNECFPALYEKYSDPVVIGFIQGMGLGLAGAVNRRANK